jgi:hypothetical protein
MIESFPNGACSEDLRQQFQVATGLERQSFYYALREAKRLGWLTGGEGRGQLYVVDYEAFSKVPASILDMELPQAAQPEEVQDEPAASRSEGANGVAIEHLTRIVADKTATLRQRLKGCSLLLSYRSDAETNAFAHRFLEKVVAAIDTPVDYKLEALEQLRRAMGDPQLKPSIVKLTPPSPPIDREAERAALKAQGERRRQHIERQAALDQEMLRQDLEQAGARLQRPNGQG